MSTSHSNSRSGSTSWGKAVTLGSARQGAATTRGQENAGGAANYGEAERERERAARRTRHHQPIAQLEHSYHHHQPIAQLEHNYHHQHQRYSQQAPAPQPNSRGFLSAGSAGRGPPRLVSSRSSTSSTSSSASLSASFSSRSSTSRVPLTRAEMSRSHGPVAPNMSARSSTRASLSRSHGSSTSVSIPAFRSCRTAKVSAHSSSDGFSASSSGHSYSHSLAQGRGSSGNDSSGSSGGPHATPYEQWRRLRRARTVSGNSSASTSSTSSFASYVVNPITGQREYDVGDEDEDEDLEMMVDDDESDTMHEPRVAEAGLPSVLQHIVAPTLPPPPYPVDPYHFYCKPSSAPDGNGGAAEVTSTLASLFAACGIEAIFHPLKCKFKCLKYVHYSHVEFVVRVYAHQRALLVEFQRRSGSVLLWDGLYRILHQRLATIVDASASRCSQSSGQKRVNPGAASLASSSASTTAAVPSARAIAPSRSAMEPQPAPPSEEEGLGAQIWRTLSLTKPTPSSGVEAMKIMLTSKFLDAQREGCAGLAELTEDVQNACLVAQAGLVTPLVRAAEASDRSMARCAMGALANVARAVPRFPHSEVALAQRTAQQLRANATPVALAQLERSDESSLFSVELLRESARAVAAFAKLASELEPRVAAETTTSDDRSLRVLRQLATHRDAQLAAHCRGALQELLHLTL